MAQLPSQIVGVVADVRSTGLNTPPEADYFLPALQRPETFTNILVRTNVGPAAMAPACGTPCGPWIRICRCSSRKRSRRASPQTIADRKLALVLLAAFAALALVLASLGVYSVMAHLVAFRTNEIGIRMALGASPGAVMRMVLGHGRRLTLLGIALGHGGRVLRVEADAAGAVRSGSGEPAHLPGASRVMLLLVAEFASWLPARRATRIDPVIALRNE